MNKYFVEWKKFAAGVIFFSAVISLTGCASDKNPDFSAVASHLDSSGCYYRVSDNGELYSTVGRFFKDFEQAVSSAYGSGNTDNEKMMAFLSAAELAVRLAGVDECRWSGASSVRLPDVIEKTFRNRSFYLLPEKTRGVVWQIPGNVNRPVIKELADLPADTLWAGDFILDLSALGGVFANSRLGKQWLDVYCKRMFKTTPDVLFKEMSGEWGFAVFPSSDRPDYFEMVLTFPDRSGRIFKHLSDFFRMIPRSRIEKNTVYVPYLGKNLAPICTYDSGRMTIFSGPKARQQFLASGTKLSSQPDFKRLSSGIPEDGLAVFYSAGVRPETRMINLPAWLGGQQFDPSCIDRPQLTVLRREKNGLSVTSNSGFDIQASDFVDLVVVPLLAAASFRQEIEALLPQRPAAVKTVSRPAAVLKADKENIDKCLVNVKKIAASLKAFAAAHGGYPLPAELAGINLLQEFRKTGAKDFVCPASRNIPARDGQKIEIANCSYVYMGSWKMKKHPKLPLLLDRPGNHPGYVHVVFNDGSVAGFKLERVDSIKHIVSFLHTKFSYEEEDFLELIRRADMLDALFEQF